MIMQTWYIICFHGNRVVHTEHRYGGYEDTRHIAEIIFYYGKTIEGNPVEFTRVVAISESHEIAVDVTGTID
jgi:hypothetical protein